MLLEHVKRNDSIFVLPVGSFSLLNLLRVKEHWVRGLLTELFHGNGCKVLLTGSHLHIHV